MSDKARTVSEPGHAAHADTRSHACDVCGGIGMTFDESRNHQDCPVCLGAGHISDAMPVADALADAETLLNFAFANMDNKPLLGAMLEAGNGGPNVMRSIGEWIPDFDGLEGEIWHSAYYATWAARAAFRAVPGLRR